MIFRTKPKYYNSIRTCPLAKWQEVKETDSLEPIWISGKFDLGLASEAWRKIMSEFLEEFGMSEEYKIYLREMANAVYDLAMSYKPGEKWRRNPALIDIAIAESYIDGPKPKFGDQLAFVAKGMGFRLDPKEVTVYEFFSNAQFLQKSNGKA